MSVGKIYILMKSGEKGFILYKSGGGDGDVQRE
jgi:hypothetical protein